MNKKTIPVHELDDLIGIAERLQEEEPEKLSLAEVQAIAEELDISPDYLQQAIQVLQQQKRDAEIEKQQQKQAKKRYKKIFLYSVVAIVLLLCISLFFSHSTLRSLYSEVELHTSHV